MANPSIPLTAARLRERIIYDPETGEITRLRWARAKKAVGRSIKSKSGNMYISVGIDYGRYLAHRLAWLWMTNEWPSGDIDHINGDGLDNRWVNLRLATRSQNNINRRVGRNNKSGHTGVRWDKRTNHWQVVFSFMYQTKEEAIEARNKIVDILAGEFAPTQIATEPRKD